MHFIKNITKPKSLVDKLFITCLCLVAPLWVHAQDASYDDIEKTQDEIESIYVNIYRIMDEYPEATFNLDYPNKVQIYGVTDMTDKKQLKTYLLNLETLKSDILNLSNRTGVYYVSETDPKPEMGYKDFYSQLYSELGYPEKAKDRGVEGTIFVKFVVDSDGEISNAIVAEDIEDADEYVINALSKEAKDAILSTSGDWKPATVGGLSVASWVVVPVQFKLKSPYFQPIY
ncbi:energy transducer TonB [Reichenbachiella ulvae]|uniref:Energy transducer TonB n=1 Tax=Reichenbachiella ulvae TaxID=2980104 RepID=A0ABT3CSN8_9BACT|nr:energy transducer TonB [Reichenbachiella ulvae]MCV9386524.1 energy transducer TonB [Reichenbachiella ulvae]